jgi:hypothetical protein
MVKIYQVIQVSLRKLIDWLMSLWLWSNNRYRAAEERKKDGS